VSGFFRCQVTLPQATQIREDDIVNVWHFDSDGLFSEDADDVAGRLIAFYQAIDGVLFSPLMGSPATIKVYDLTEPEPRVPGYMTTFTVTPSAGTPLPPEIACVLSMRGAVVSGANIPRRTGRIYLGACRAEAMATTANRSTFSSSTRTTIRDAAVTLATGEDPGDGRLAIFSPTTAGPSPWTESELDEAYNDAVTVWVDDMPDVQRRRGHDATARTTGTI
jgi:hypothetical protein